MDREITLRDYGRVIWSGRWLILATTVAAAVVGLVLTFATSATYAAEAVVFVGQATTSNGTPVSTAVTNPGTVTQVLTGDAVVSRVAKELGVTPKRVRDDVSVSAPKPQGGSLGNQPTIVTVKFQDRNREVARNGANAYARAVLDQAKAGFAGLVASFGSAVSSAQDQVDSLQAQMNQYRRQLATASTPEGRLSLTVLLSSAGQQLQVASTYLQQQRLLRDTQSQFQPQIISLASNPSSSGGVRNRARSVLLAAVIGLLAGVIVTFVWRGSPAGRAGRE